MFELVLRAPQALVEAVRRTDRRARRLSVSVEDADADSDAEQALFGEPGMPAPQPGWSPLDAAGPVRLGGAGRGRSRLAAGARLDVRPAGAGLQAVADQDWVRITQSQFEPIAITPTFWIVPSWHEPPAAAAQVIRLDPGMAFGTGTHPTTRMCLRWIAQRGDAAQGKVFQRVLDYGCGSGILAIAAALHGAARSTRSTSMKRPWRRRRPTPRPTAPAARRLARPGTWAPTPLVLANILATPLKLLAPLLCGHLAPGAPLVLAGILSRQTAELQAAYAPWLELSVADEDDGWVLLTGTSAQV
jgi:ribosomal protein L11 methyltransferase